MRVPLGVARVLVPPGVRWWLNMAVRDPINDMLDDRRLRRAAREGGILRVEVGKARVPALRGWYRTNINTLNMWDEKDWVRLFERENRLSNLLAEHVLEHIAPKLLEVSLRHCYRFLRPGGRLRISVPDGFNPDPSYIALAEPGGRGPAADDHRQLFNIESLTEYLQAAGFEVVPIEYYDSAGEYHCVGYDEVHGIISRAGQPPPQRSLNVDAVKPLD